MSGPRSIPAGLALRLLFQGAWNQFGWFGLGFNLTLLRGTYPQMLAGGDIPSLLFFLVFALLFSIPLWIGLRKGLLGLRLLRRGVPAVGKLVADEKTNVFMDDRPVRRLRFLFTLPDGRPFGATAWTEMTKRLTDQGEEPLLYDPEDPDVSVLLDDLPGRPRIDDAGIVRAATAGIPWRALLAPGGFALLNIAWSIIERVKG